MSSPFKTKCYPLAHCSLIPLQPSDSVVIAEQLSQMSPWHTLGYSAVTLENYLQQEDAGLRKYAVMTEQLSGVLCVRYPWLRGAYIELVALFPAQQGLGIGHELIQWLATESAPHANLWALVSAINVSARRFYQREGFVEVGQLQDFVTEGFDEILLRKPLSVPQK